MKRKIRRVKGKGGFEVGGGGRQGYVFPQGFQVPIIVPLPFPVNYLFLLLRHPPLSLIYPFLPPTPPSFVSLCSCLAFRDEGKEGWGGGKEATIYIITEADPVVSAYPPFFPPPFSPPRVTPSSHFYLALRKWVNATPPPHFQVQLWIPLFSD